jgi:hypothetical protein
LAKSELILATKNHNQKQGIFGKKWKKELAKKYGKKLTKNKKLKVKKFREKTGSIWQEN